MLRWVTKAVTDQSTARGDRTLESWWLCGNSGYKAWYSRHMTTVGPGSLRPPGQHQDGLLQVDFLRGAQERLVGQPLLSPTPHSQLRNCSSRKCIMPQLRRVWMSCWGSPAGCMWHRKSGLDPWAIQVMWGNAPSAPTVSPASMSHLRA